MLFKVLVLVFALGKFSECQQCVGLGKCGGMSNDISSVHGFQGYKGEKGQQGQIGSVGFKGSKGESCGRLSEIQGDLDKQFGRLRGKINRHRKKVLNEEPIEFTIRLLDSWTYSLSLDKCKRINGTIISTALMYNFEGKRYKRVIDMYARRYPVWIGVNKRGGRGYEVMGYDQGDYYYPPSPMTPANNVYEWATGEPRDEDKDGHDCVYLAKDRNSGNKIRMFLDDCEGFNEVLCQIRVY